MIDEIVDVLKPIGVPVSYMTYTGTKSTYIVFNWWSSPSLIADDMEQSEYVTVQIDVFSKADFTNIINDVKRLMKAANFMRVHEGTGNIVEDTNIFRKTLRFSIKQGVDY